MIVSRFADESEQSYHGFYHTYDILYDIDYDLNYDIIGQTYDTTVCKNVQVVVSP